MKKKTGAEKMLDDARRISVFGEAQPGDLKKHHLIAKLMKEGDRRRKINSFFKKILKILGIKEKQNTEIVL